MERRDFLATMCYGGIATFAAPLVRFATVPGAGRLVFVQLRGGFDGLAALVPIGDPAYAPLRGDMAYQASELTTLGDGFALAPGLAPLHQLWDARQLVALHAMAIPFRTRSHFDGQAILETGLGAPDGSADGWLNRLLQVMDGKRSAIAVAAGMPRSLTGKFPVSTWSPAELGVVDNTYLDRLHVLYRTDGVLLTPFEEAILQRSEAGDMAAPAGSRAGAGRTSNISSIFKAAAKLIRVPDGPNVAEVEFSGWDTHVGQGMADGLLDRRLSQLAQGLVDFKEAMGEDWEGTTVVVMTEFGRTARPNGSRGTDHGTAGAGFVIGSRLAKSAVISDWPGLAERQLFEGRDVRPTIDTRAVLKSVIEGTFDLTGAQADRIFPGSDEVSGLRGLMS